MRILVTGCSGYVGANLVPRLVREGHEVVGVDRVPWGGGEEITFHRADLLDPGRWKRALQGVDLVIHLAAAKADWGLTEERYRRDNVEATRALLEEGRRAGVREWLLYSSVAAMGPGAVGRDGTAELAPSGPYGITKAESERLFVEAVEEDPCLRVGILRPSVIFGPGHPDSTNVYRLIEALSEGHFLMVGDGDVVKSTSYIENVVAATVFMMEGRPGPIETFVYLDEPQITTGQLVRDLCRLLGRPEPRLRIPRALASGLAKPMDVLGGLLGVDFATTSARIDKFCRPTHYDSGRIRDAGFVQPVCMETALERTVAWHRARNGGPPAEGGAR